MYMYVYIFIYLYLILWNWFQRLRTDTTCSELGALSHANELILKFLQHFCFVFGKLVDKFVETETMCWWLHLNKFVRLYVRRFLILKVDKYISRQVKNTSLCLVLSNQRRKHWPARHAWRTQEYNQINIHIPHILYSIYLFLTVFLVTVAWAAFIHTLLFSSLDLVNQRVIHLLWAGERRNNIIKSLQ